MGKSMRQSWPICLHFESFSKTRKTVGKWPAEINRVLLFTPSNAFGEVRSVMFVTHVTCKRLGATLSTGGIFNAVQISIYIYCGFFIDVDCDRWWQSVCVLCALCVFWNWSRLATGRTRTRISMCRWPVRDIPAAIMCHKQTLRWPAYEKNTRNQSPLPLRYIRIHNATSKTVYRPQLNETQAQTKHLLACRLAECRKQRPNWYFLLLFLFTARFSFSSFSPTSIFLFFFVKKKY